MRQSPQTIAFNMAEEYKVKGSKDNNTSHIPCLCKDNKGANVQVAWRCFLIVRYFLFRR